MFLESLMQMTGKIFTDVFGSNKDFATNGNLAKILRYCQLCLCS